MPSLASPKTVAVALEFGASSSSPSFPRSGLRAGEVVEVRRAWICVSASPAGLGGEGREEREVVGVPFWLQVALVVFFVDASALAGRGGEGSCVRRW